MVEEKKNYILKRKSKQSKHCISFLVLSKMRPDTKEYIYAGLGQGTAAVAGIRTLFPGGGGRWSLT